jgi:ABC-type Fe3+ transport system substrate-binding protein
MRVTYASTPISQSIQAERYAVAISGPVALIMKAANRENEQLVVEFSPKKS